VDPSQYYAPTRVDCPSDIQWVRSAHEGLNPLEAEWIKSRKLVVLQNFGQYLERLGLEDFNVSAYLNKINVDASGNTNVPALGLAISGGGYGSAYTGTGAMRALDDRLPAAIEQRTGGLLQSLLYQSGLSGGSWPTVSFLANGFPTADDIVQSWRPEIVRPASGNSTQYAANVTDLFQDLTAKFKAGFPVTIGDWFGRAWSYEYFPGPHGGVNTTFSSYVDIPEFKNHQAPLPILHMTTIKPTDPYFDGFQMPYENASTVRQPILDRPTIGKFVSINVSTVRSNALRIRKLAGRL
jgi:lysophospholipase